ncbi:MAG TPA: type I methionyl aminopeptidase [Thermoguttaceae bacterium]|nr:type I methionyl aminopeptidase [Thermoguttaceae bacterium]
MEELKTPREIGLMRQAGLLVWEAHQLVASMLRPGISTGELDAAVERFYQDRNAEPLFKGFPHADEGCPPFPAVTCISINEEVVHGIPGSRQVLDGDIVSIDTGCKFRGWCGDAAVTHPVGRVRPETLRLLEVTRNVLELSVELIGKCRRWREVAAEMEKYVKKSGFSVVEAFVGHGIGKKMHEDPQVPNFAGKRSRRSTDFALEPGLVIAVEPMVNLGTKQVRSLRDHWTQVTADGLPSAHFEHTIAVTESAPLVLTAGPNGESW